ncbi:MAG: flagellar hook-associated protein FlgK [Phycisphaerae bacterium]
MGASFQIGRSALAAYQSAIAISGQNIANVGNADYSRQTGRLSALEGGVTLGGVAPGGGVVLSALERHVDEAIESRLRTALGQRAAAESSHQTLSDLETLYYELTDYDLSTELTELYNAFAAMQNDPDEMPTRNLVIAAMDRVTQSLQRQRAAVVDQAVTMNVSIEQAANRAAAIADEIAGLNETVVVQESRGAGFGSPLRDRRDTLLRELAGLMDIQVHEQSNGAVNVYVGSEPLVEFNRSRGLSVETEQVDGLEQATVRFSDNNGLVLVKNGTLGAQLESREEHLLDQIDRLDQLARGLIYEINRVQSTGRGLVGYESITGAYAVKDVDAALDSSAADLPFPLENGSFIVHVRNQDTGQEITRLIEVDLDGIDDPNVAGDEDTTLASLAAALNDVPGLTAAVTTDRRLQIDAGAGSEVWFSEDSSGALAALGVGAMLTGVDAATISVADDVWSDPRLIAASLSGAANDGDNAGRFAALGETASTLLNNQTAEDFHAAMVNDVAIKTSSAATAYEAADAVYSSLNAQREAVSGVSLDEEAINLTRYERAYQGVARYLTVLDDLTYEVLSLVT